MSLALLVALPFIGSAVAAFLPTNARNIESTWAGLVTLAGLVPLILMVPEVRDGGVIRQDIAWLPSLGLNLVIRMDGCVYPILRIRSTSRLRPPPSSTTLPWSPGTSDTSPRRE